MGRAIRFWGFWVLCGVLASGCGSDREAGTIEGPARNATDVQAIQHAQDRARTTLDGSTGRRDLPQRNILFGDLHVHTTFSIDAFVFSLPLMAGEGAHPPADACDFARYCANLDFYALTDHAAGITPEHWREEKESIRECNERAGSEQDPDLVAFMGFEWTQVGLTPQTHWGHKNVIFPGTREDQLPLRPINSLPDGPTNGLFSGLEKVTQARWIDPLGWNEYADFLWMIRRIDSLPLCDREKSTRELPEECRENAPTPEVLFKKLDQWGFDSMVIPHGTSWGLYTPPGTSFDKQLTPLQNDPQRQPLIEVMSGHGNSEEYRPWRAARTDAAGNLVCPEPTPDYLPCCWQAGEIMRSRCGDLPEKECESRVAEARRLALEAGARPQLVFPDSGPEDWLDCGQCRDCFKPAFSQRPRETVQYAMSLSNRKQTDSAGRPSRFRFGFIASSDNHTARPGTGYKQVSRRAVMTEASGPRSRFFLDRSLSQRGVSQPDPQRASPAPATPLFGAADFERTTSFLYPGGLAAVHAEGRSRKAIWEALERKEVYGTSGPRILLWFDLLNGPQDRRPMGSEAEMQANPRFEVRAIGSRTQKPGCPESSQVGLVPERLEKLCKGECYNPSDRRHAIRAIEVVRIRPQTRTGEDLGLLIEDPWRRFECEPNKRGCVVRFEDPAFRSSGRDALYYVRALQEETPAINGKNLNTRFDASGNPIAISPCYGDFRTPFQDDCLAPVQERAWSSPIFIDQPR